MAKCRWCAVVLALTLSGCLAHRGLPQWEPVTPTDLALDSMPREVNRRCGQALSSLGGEGYPRFRLVALSSRDSTGPFLETAVPVQVSRGFASRRVTPGFRAPIKPGNYRCSGGGGGGVGSLHINLWQRIDTVWIDSTAIPMRFNNVLLLTVDDAGRFKVAGRAHVRPR